MRYAWPAIATLLTPVILLLAVGYLLYRPGPSPAARETLDGYLSMHNRTVNKSESVQSMLRSSRPGAFTADMSRITYGSSWYFGSTYTAEGSPGDPASRPAPFPPTDLWCVAVGGPDGQPHTVLLVQHEDLYVAAWIVHEPVSEAAARRLCP